jgi:hypothetical protein
MEMRPATIIAIVVVIIALIVPVFFLDLDDPEGPRGNAPEDPPANAPHPQKPSPEIQRELDRIRNENRQPTPAPANDQAPLENRAKGNEAVN